MRDLIGPLGDRGRDAMPAQPSPLRLRGVARVRNQAVRPRPGPPTGAGHADQLQRVANIEVSATCPPVTTNASTLPLPSQTR
ncbi:hypothetical protein HMPREF0569_0868 [Micrococcus luteus SK58]|nr:hypothetical protein HMPREF0569_0868 [Micrococcus luteus SK58]